MADFFVAKHTIKRSDGPFLVDFFSSWKFVNMLRSPWYKLIITDNSPLPPCIYSIGRFGKICWKSVTRRKNQPLLFSAGWWNWHRGRKAKTYFPEFWAGSHFIAFACKIIAGRAEDKADVVIRLADFAGNIDTGQISHENIKDYKVIKSGSKAGQKFFTTWEIINGNCRRISQVIKICMKYF